MCYWKQQFEWFEQRQPLSVLKNELAELRARLADLPKEIAEAERAQADALARSSWWTRLWDSDPAITLARERHSTLYDEKYKVERRLPEIERTIEVSNKLSKRVRDARLARATAEQHRIDREAQKKGFAEGCKRTLNQEFDRAKVS